ncbi:MAG: SagB/ThcOx family dehydrogenase [Rickettsiales bacterium]|nr:SagB/ThcOx family dehydrogenase [Pseudomonadota bacterium]MDA0966382.1 SagB/ThcOx family dehydrogenase [Pseudomonadota bacterium]MDG4544015.1 SagB/ThcOx family dehydrogenase [Rickettsiales bacterium]MDG4545509.1 SagB/ThcOx family dehydrogenase [Rickettsiales bacterium]MDG4547958.1 SagB/ThcOx family dehydrogenase [Rickettsiales bacterium]
MAKKRKTEKKQEVTQEQPEQKTFFLYENTNADSIKENYVIGSHIGAKIGEDKVTVVNLISGERIEFDADIAKLIEYFLVPKPLDSVLSHCDSEETGEDYLLKLYAAVKDLIEMDALVASSRESGPGPVPKQLPEGWYDACNFIQATRTGSQARYLTQEELAHLHVRDLMRGRQPSCFYDRGDLPFFELPNPIPILDKYAEQNKNNFMSVLFGRRSTRRYSDKPVSLEELGTILYLSWGATALMNNPLGDHFVRKVSPSGGSLHPIEVYPVISNVEGLPPGCYHYSVKRHGLEQIIACNPKEWMGTACGGQEWIAECPVSFLTTAFLPRMAWKYDFSRAFRVVMADVGHTSQTLHLSAKWLGLGSFTTCATRDEIFEEYLGLDRLVEPVMMVNGIGHIEKDVLSHERPRSETVSE